MKCLQHGGADCIVSADYKGIADCLDDADCVGSSDSEE